MENKKWITVVGAREHNLKNITATIPKDSLTVITGPSGSGKSSLALDILYAEGQRRYMESLSSYARQFLGIPKKPDFDRIDGLSPAIAIDQKTVGSNPRSTVGTITEIYDYLRILYARIGETHCPTCNALVQSCSYEQIATIISENNKGKLVTIVAPVVQAKKGEFTDLIKNLFKNGHYRYSIDEKLYKFSCLEEIDNLKLGKTYKHTINVILDSITLSISDKTEQTEITDEKVRLIEAITKACDLTEGLCKSIVGNQEQLYSTQRICLQCNSSFSELEPRIFSFNSPLGACKQCQGIGTTHNHHSWRDLYTQANINFSENATDGIITCTSCQGKRLHKHALAVTIANQNIHDLSSMSIKHCLEFFKNLKLKEYEQILVERLLSEIINRLIFLNNVGLGYLSLHRTAKTLSGGEGQRIRLARQLGSALSGILYILDEPSIGLHQRDNDQLIKTLQYLRDQGNTVVVVEHDHDTMLHADYIIDMGPAAGILGGSIVAAGTPDEISNNTASLTGDYLSGRRSIKQPEKLRNPSGFITLKNANAHNLKNVTVAIPLGVLCCISGVSGSGKSSLVMEALVPTLQAALLGSRHDATTDTLSGSEQLESIVVIDQSPIGRTSRSNLATYLGVFDEIRQLFAGLPTSNARGYTVSHFSFNVTGGRCETCKGDGFITVSMHFLPDVSIQCKQCKGLRYTKQVLEISYKNKNIAQVLDMTVYEALSFFSAHKKCVQRLQLLCDVGLDYVKLGQASTTLSGGEAQRIKLVHELAKRGHKTLYVLDEPTTGLHTNDIEKLLEVFNRLINKGNSMIVIEHNLDVLKTADYIIDLGPEGGDAGGAVVASGTPVEISHCQLSHTGHYLKKML